MRCDKKVFFVTKGKRVLHEHPLDPEYGNYTEAADTAAEKMADVTDTQAKTQQLIYGRVSEGNITVRLNEVYDTPFDYISFGDRKYAADASRHLRRRSTFICHEVK